jgi:hypothetical protein
MQVNMGTVDRVIRGIVGLVLVLAPFLTSWGLFSTQWVVYLSVLVGLVMGGTAIFGVCPLYSLLGMNTCKS